MINKIDGEGMRDYLLKLDKSDMKYFSLEDLAKLTVYLLEKKVNNEIHGDASNPEYQVFQEQLDDKLSTATELILSGDYLQ